MKILIISLMLNNDPWKNNKLSQDELAQRGYRARRTALMAGAVALMFYAGFMLLGILNQ